VTATAFARASVQRLARALDLRDAAAVLDAGLLVTTTVRRETVSELARRRATAILDAVLVAAATPLPDDVRRRIEAAADELGRTQAGGCLLDAADGLEALWRDVAATLTAPAAIGVDAAVEICLAERLHERARLDDLARVLGYSPSHVSELVRRVTGERFTTLRRRLRLERARAALARGLSVKQAAAEAGFDDPAYFSRVFRRAFGVAPGRWRRGVAVP
jgi:AraC-like DNA-binding protein